MPTETLIDLIADLMESDDESRSKQSGYLEEHYLSGSIEERALIDKCFIALCGYSLKRLIGGNKDV